VQADKVGVESARQLHGVVVSEQGEVDLEATQSLRGDLRARASRQDSSIGA
jgi:hypothetical protein